MLLEKLRGLSKTIPLQPAVVAGAEVISFADLERRSSSVASFLTVDGLPQDSLVAIYTRRDVNAIVALFGVLKIGAAYTFVEDDGNREENYCRLSSIEADAVICATEHHAALQALDIRALDINTALHAVDMGRIGAPDRNATAYVLFTSGSTGKPKGVCVSHGNIEHYVESVAQRLDVGVQMNYAHVSTLAADLGNTSLLLSLTSGGCLHLLSAELRKDPAAFRDYLSQHSIDFLKITPSHWNAIFPAGQDTIELPALKYLVFGGEALPKGLAQRILESGRITHLYNHYGPTEATVGVTVYPVTRVEQIDELAADSIPIGRPLGRTRLMVRTDGGEFVERSAKGELFIGGPSVAKGYLGNPQETDRCFVNFQGAEGVERFYKTGDLVSVDAGGLVQFLGRADRQIKVNGYRVELEHIESVMRALYEVEDAAVFYLDYCGRNRLVAAVLPHAGTDVAGLKEQLASLLPDYMIPKSMLVVSSFPRNANGKTSLSVLRETVVARLAESASAGGTAQTMFAADDERLSLIHGVFCKHLHGGAADLESNFFDQGGDSLDAIQLIAELQDKGYPVTAHAFLKNPSIQGLLTTLDDLEGAASEVKAPRNLNELRLFSAAQHEFFQQQLEYPDHYNQAMLLRSADNIDMATLNCALTMLVESHPALSVAYGLDLGGLRASHVDQDGNDTLSVSFIPGHSEAEIQGHVERVSARVHKSLSLEEGRLFRVHLFKVKNGDDLLLLVAHHLAVDVISWRLIVAELTRHYSDRYYGSVMPRSPSRTTFWDWVEHLEAHKASLSDPWLTTTLQQADALPGYYDPSNTEGDAATLWLGFSLEESQVFMRDLVNSSGAQFHLLLLAAFALALGKLRLGKPLAIDVESHGRTTFDDSTDVSRVVGWHTSTFPMMFGVVPNNMADALALVSRTFAQVSNLGVGFGLLRHADSVDYVPSAPVCFNYLGDVNFAHDERFELTPAKFSFGHARNEHNNRCHELKLTARVIDGHLLIDLAFPRTTETADMHELLCGISAELAALSGIEARAAQIVLERGARTGMISYAPKQLIAQARRQQHREYQHVLLTGATGYIGAYALKELIFQSNAHIHCLVRSKNGVTTQQRLEALFDGYFPGVSLAGFRGRLTVHEGDVCEAKLGLDPDAYQQLSRQIDAIYHFAADTRLFGTEEEFAKSNIQSVKSCIELAECQRVKDLHYMSTLAVAGVNSKPEVAFFCEDSLDIGQVFQNNYELTKAAAERLVNAFRLRGQQGFIYRSGNVSGDSLSARFQNNAKDNRLVQFLTSCVKGGQLPGRVGEPVVLSPVDEVAAGIVAISLDAASAPGTYHVDSIHEVSMERVFSALERAGFIFAPCEYANFAQLFESIEGVDDPDILLGKFWASRKRRNIKYRNDRTLRTLDRLGRGFTTLSDEWLDDFVARLKQEDVFAMSLASTQRGAAKRAAQARS